jgi:cysteine-rich repeat protein
VCYSVCGDGVVSSDEECDDGNQFSGDGCGPDCKVETAAVGLWMCVGEPSNCTRRLCELDVNVSKKDVGCHGGLTGSIELSVSTYKNEAWVARVYKEGSTEKGEFEVASLFKNLGEGNYMIEVHVDGFEKCGTTRDIAITAPPALKTNKNPNDFWSMLGNKAPSCNGNDGKFTWPVTGGVNPKTYTFGPFNTTDGKFTGLSMSTFYNYRPRVTDANGCVLDLEDAFYSQFPDPDKTCQKGAIDQFLADLWDTGGRDGLIIIGGTFLVVIIMGIGYCCWSNDKQVPKSAQKRPPPK